MIRIYCSKADATLQETETLTAGMVNTPVVQFTFSSDWNGLGKSAIVRAGTVIKEVVVTNNQIVVPSECLAKAGVNLIIGVWGGNFTTELPTVWCACGEIQDATNPNSALNHEDATASNVAQMLAAAERAEAALDQIENANWEDVAQRVGVEKVNKPTSSPNGVEGQILRTNGDGSTLWIDPPDIFDEEIDTAIQTWLDEHPEATTTVQDESLTWNKLVKGTLGYVTPEMYGAVGDGVTDDSSAFISAIADGRPIRLGNKKTYLITQTLNLNENTQLIGDGTPKMVWSTQNASRSKLSADGKNNIRLEGIIFDAGEQTYSSSDFSITNATNLRVVKCTFLNSYGTALRIHGDSYSSIEECHFEDITGEGGNPGEAIYGMNFHDIEITGCTCNHVGDHFLYADGYNDLYNIVISNCILNDTGNNDLTNGGAICTYNNVHNITITNCTIKPHGAGMNIGSHATPLIASHDVVISNCSFEGGSFGIVLGGITDDYQAQNIVITGCNFKDQSIDAIRAVYVKHVVISDFVISGCTNTGINADNFYDSIITNGLIKDIGSNGVGLLIGSGRGTGSANNVTVDNLRVYGNSEGTSGYSVYFRRGSNYSIGQIEDDGNFTSAAVYPAGYKKSIMRFGTWTPVKSSGSYAGNISQNRSAYYAICGSLVYIFAEFKVDTAGTGYMTLTGLPDNLISSFASGNTIISNTAKIGQSIAGNNYGTIYLNCYFQEENPIVAAGNTVQVWAIGISG